MGVSQRKTQVAAALNLGVGALFVSWLLTTDSAQTQAGTIGDQQTGVSAPERPLPEPTITQRRAKPTVSSTPNVKLVGADDDDRARFEQALGRFSDNGLDLPDLEVRFFDDPTACDGHYGLFQKRYEPWRIVICSNIAFVPTHELAHAWESANLDDADRERYVAARGLSTWDDRDTPWRERGREDAAVVIQQNLTASYAQLTSPRWQEFVAAYELLTGRPSPALSEGDDVVAVANEPQEVEPTAPASEPEPAETSFTTLREHAVADHLPSPVCLATVTADDLTEFFDLQDPLLGADYQRSFALPDGRVLWLFQDAFLATSSGPRLVHNAGLLQSGRCFQVLRTGSPDNPAPFILPELTERFDRWFWPLGGDVGEDGNFHVFVAELRERSSGYLVHTEPVATWLVSIELENLTVVDAQPAPNASNALYGWSVVSHADHTYLYAHCYRQFGWDPFPFAEPPVRAHDWTCGPDVTVARIPRAEFRAPLEYWNGTAWVPDASEAVPVIPREDRPVNPAQVASFDGRFVAVTKVGDWWGDTIHLDVAASPEGPWRTYATISVPPECDRCNTYFASFVPFGADDDSFVIGISGNTWAGDDLEHYSPRFLKVPAPPHGTFVPPDRDSAASDDFDARPR